ncbi:hypothetical protein BASA81_013713 [Batrachochytrium salamandrivorans]|nr:hypothetical protein BASA81_013713 [Batrachochytrium salamandrivorans]
MELDRRFMRAPLGQDAPLSNEFVAYTDKNAPPRGKTTRRIVHYSPQELDMIQQMACKTSSGSQRAQLQQQNANMHAASMERVKTWGNTIQGYRKKRLAAQDEKTKCAEEDRIKVDVDWAVLREKERQEAVQRAKTIQLLQQPQARALHSQLLMSNVLDERDKQIEYKKRHILATRIQDSTDVLKMRQSLLAEIQDEKNKAAQQHVRNLRFSVALQQEMAQKMAHKTAERQTEHDYYRQLHMNILQEEKEKDVLLQVKKEQAAKNQCTLLAKMIQEKKDYKAVEKISQKQLEIANKMFTDRQEYQAIKKQAYEHHIAKQRDDRYEVVSKIPYRLDKEADEKRRAYIEKTSHTKDNDHDIRKNAEMIKHKQHLQERYEFQEERKRILNTRAANEKRMVEQYRLELLANSEIYKREAVAEENRKHLEKLQINMYQTEQIESNQCAAIKTQQAKAKVDASIAASRQAENEAFDDYAASVLSEWHAMGRNTSPIEMSLEREKRGCLRLYPAEVKKL